MKKFLIIFFITIITAGLIWVVLLIEKLKAIRVRPKKVNLKESLNLILTNPEAIRKLLELEINVLLEFENFSSRDLKVNNYLIEIYDEQNGKLLARNTIDASFIIKAKTSTEVNVPMLIRTPSLIEFLTGNINPNNLLNLITNITAQNKIGKKLRVKGFVRIDNIPFRKNLNELIEI